VWLTQHRLHNHRITHTEFTRPGDVVTWFGAMQAQDYSHSKWAVGLRCPGATDASIEQAIAERSIVRTWAMRGTLQLVAPQDVRWLLQLVGPRIIARGAGDDLRRFGLDEAEFAKIDKLFDKILRGTILTRKETYAAMKAHGISTDGQRGYYILARAGLRGQICFGEWRGKEETFTLLEEWLPPAKPLPREEALAELALRYFRSHGPATLQDYVWWSSLTVGEARAGLDGAKSQLVQESVGDVTYWLPNDTSPTKAKSPDVHLLPGFDEYLLGYTDRSPVLEKVHNASVIHSNGIFKPTVVVDGQIVGTWSRKVVKGKAVVTSALFDEMSARMQQAVEVAAHLYSEFLEGGGNPS